MSHIDVLLSFRSLGMTVIFASPPSEVRLTLRCTNMRVGTPSDTARVLQAIGNQAFAADVALRRQ